MTNIAVALNEPEKDIIIRLTEGHSLIAPEVPPFEIGNALTAMMKKEVLNIAREEDVMIKWREGEIFTIAFKKSPFDVSGIKTKATTQDILAAIKDSREGMTERED